MCSSSQLPWPQPPLALLPQLKAAADEAPKLRSKLAVAELRASHAEEAAFELPSLQHDLGVVQSELKQWKSMFQVGGVCTGKGVQDAPSSFW